ncbi:hypothetical protein [Lactonifactor longoviformis]|uniref:hypothetical protein n=1 Tax=Lactonifactor longoviformis TaxID=341220 RepID=UPI0036F3B662
MEQQDSLLINKDSGQNRRRWMPALFLLLFIALITSCVVGFILGRNAGPASLGQIIDTILLTPEEPSSQTVFHLSGQVLYSDGTPVSGRNLELHSDPVATVSGSDGSFLFPNITEGNHTIFVLNPDGTAAAQRELQIQYSDAGEASIELQDNGAYVIQLSLDIRMLEILIELDGEDIYINSENISYATRDGRVVTPAGSASVKDGVIVTPRGNVCLPDGSIVFPGGSKDDTTYIIQTDDTVLLNRDTTAGDIKVSSDGTINLPDGTVIEPGGRITTPDGSNITPGNTGVLIKDETVVPIGGSPQGQVKPQTPGTADTPPVSGNGQVTTPSQSGTSDSPDRNTGTQPGTSDSSNTNNPGGGNSSTTVVPDQGKLQTSRQDKDGSFKEWEQNASINLFYNHETGEIEKIAPGSSGYYVFRLKNARKEKLTVTLNIAESSGSPHLPLKFTLHPQGQKGGTFVSLGTSGEGAALETVLAAGAQAVYQLDWEWPFESGNDESDTAAGSRGSAYVLLLNIHAEGKD